MGGLLVTAHPSTANVPIIVLLHDGPLLCGLNVAIKGLTECKTKPVIDGIPFDGQEYRVVVAVDEVERLLVGERRRRR